MTAAVGVSGGGGGCSEMKRGEGRDPCCGGRDEAEEGRFILFRLHTMAVGSTATKMPMKTTTTTMVAQHQLSIPHREKSIKAQSTLIDKVLVDLQRGLPSLLAIGEDARGEEGRGPEVGEVEESKEG